MTNQEAFTAITEHLAPLGVIEGKMFGMPVWKVNGKVMGGPWQNDMVFKLTSPVLDEALALPGAKLFGPMGGRPMKEWVQLGPDHQDKWQYFAEAARATIST